MIIYKLFKMSFTYLTWGKSKNSLQKQAKEIEEGRIKSEIQKVYHFDNCMLYISQGELYKEGLLPFEKKENNSKASDCPKLIFLKAPNLSYNIQVIDLALGTNHILILTKNGLLYSWGDNYYGQLGLNTYFVPYVYDPHLIKLQNIEDIMCYKNNSYAIDSSRKLWVWGKCDLSGFNYKGNLFKPTQILSHQYIDKMKISDGRLIFEVRHYKSKKDVDKKQSNINNKQELNKIEDKSKERILASGKNSFIVNNQTKEKSSILYSKRDIDITVNENDKKRVIDLILKIEGSVREYNETFNSELKQIYSILSRSFLENKHELRKIGWENIWEDIDKIISNSSYLNINKNMSNKIDINNLEFSEIAKEIAKSFKFLVSGRTIEFIKNEKFDIFESLSRTYTQTNVSNLNISNQFKDIQVTIQKLMNYNLKLRKLEFITYKMSSLQFLFNSTKFFNMIDALETIKHRDDFIEKRLEIICKLVESLKSSVSKYKNFKKSISEVFIKLNEIQFEANSDENLSSEVFTHKYIIDITSNLKYLWESLLSSIESEKELKEQITKENGLFDKYKEIYGIHIYLNTLGINNILEQKGNFTNNEDKGITSKFNSILNELDGVINRLDSIISNKLQTKETNLTNEFTLYYGYSLLDVAYLKKYLLSIQRNLSKYLAKNNLNHI